MQGNKPIPCDERNNEMIHLWADGFGIWHASVPLTDDEREDARRARQAIRTELEARGTNPKYLRTLRVTREDVTGHGTARYREA